MTQQGKSTPIPNRPRSIGEMLPKDYIPVGPINYAEAAQNQLRNYMYQLITNNARNDYPTIGPALIPMYEAEADRLSQPSTTPPEYYQVARDVNNMADRLSRLVDARSRVGIFSRGKNVYKGGLPSPTNKNTRMTRSDLIKASRERLLRNGRK